MHLLENLHFLALLIPGKFSVTMSSVRLAARSLCRAQVPKDFCWQMPTALDPSIFLGHGISFRGCWSKRQGKEAENSLHSLPCLVFWNHGALVQVVVACLLSSLILLHRAAHGMKTLGCTGRRSQAPNLTCNLVSHVSKSRRKRRELNNGPRVTETERVW